MREVEAGRQLVGSGRVEGWYYGSVIVRGLNGVLGKRGLGVGVTEDELTTATAVLKQHREERDKQQQAEIDGIDRPKQRGHYQQPSLTRQQQEIQTSHTQLHLRSLRCLHSAATTGRSQSTSRPALGRQCMGGHTRCGEGQVRLRAAFGCCAEWL